MSDIQKEFSDNIAQESEKIVKNKELFDRIGERAMKDSHFRKKLRDDPISVLREEGIEIPNDIEIRVMEVDPKHTYLFIPSEDMLQLLTSELKK
jgi:hypothetical protein